MIKCKISVNFGEKRENFEVIITYDEVFTGNNPRVVPQSQSTSPKEELEEKKEN